MVMNLSPNTMEALFDEMASAFEMVVTAQRQRAWSTPFSKRMVMTTMNKILRIIDSERIQLNEHLQPVKNAADNRWYVWFRSRALPQGSMRVSGGYNFVSEARDHAHILSRAFGVRVLPAEK